MKYGWLIIFYFTIIFKDIKRLEVGSINIDESPRSRQRTFSLKLRQWKVGDT